LQENGEKFIQEEEKLKEKFGKTSLNKMITEGPPSAEDIAKMQAEVAKE
jgi:import inner membrane translocase subunit TIM50